MTQIKKGTNPSSLNCRNKIKINLKIWIYYIAKKSSLWLTFVILILYWRIPISLKLFYINNTLTNYGEGCILKVNTQQWLYYTFLPFTQKIYYSVIHLFIFENMYRYTWITERKINFVLVFNRFPLSRYIFSFTQLLFIIQYKLNKFFFFNITTCQVNVILSTSFASY